MVGGYVSEVDDKSMILAHPPSLIVPEDSRVGGHFYDSCEDDVGRGCQVLSAKIIKMIAGCVN